jgi:hypothetical protein
MKNLLYARNIDFSIFCPRMIAVDQQGPKSQKQEEEQVFRFQK